MATASENVRSALTQSIKRAYIPEHQVVRSLVMISGGLDSVALLANLLEHTAHQVHAHHVEIHNSERRVDAENVALARSLEFVRARYRDFGYSASRYELMLGLGGGLDMSVVMFMAARYVIATECTTELVWTGHYMETPAHEIAESSGVFNSCFSNNRYKPMWMTPFRHCSKLDVYGSIPRKLVDMTWSCRTPIHIGNRYEACGQCHACETRARTLARL